VSWKRDNKERIRRRVTLAAVFLAALGVLAYTARAVDVVSNGHFDTDLSGWTHTNAVAEGTRDRDATVGGVAPGSLRYLTFTGRRQDFEGYDVTSLGTINSTDQVTISFWWSKYADAVQSLRNELIVSIILPDGQTEVELWSDTQNPGAGQTLGGVNTGPLDVSSSFSATGEYQLKVYGRLRSGNNSAAFTQWNIDDIVVDVQVPANNPPVLTASATQVSPATIETTGNETTTLSATFTDADAPGVGAFNVTFRVREPDDATEVVLVNNQPNGGGGLTISDNGGGSYTASYTWDPAPGQTPGAYDLYCELTDGTDTAIDDYAANPNELTLTTNSAPVLTAGATQVSPATVEVTTNETTTVSATFTDADAPGVGAFNVTFRVREPDDATEVVLVNNQPDGVGGLAVTDNGGGSYTASYTWNPGPGQTPGAYDLFCEVTDGPSTATDDYTNNVNELTLTANSAPVLAAGATAVTKSPVARSGADVTTIYATFTDADQPGAGAFNVTFRVREPDDATELTLVSNQPNGGGGLTIVDNGGGSYTAEYTWDPATNQTLGLYDLYCEVTDGPASAIDDYTANLDELEVVNNVTNNPPVFSPGATQVSPASIDPTGSETTTISATFTDADGPGVGAFNVTFKVREPGDVTEVTLVDNQPNGSGGLTITDGGGNTYTATYTWDPAPGQTAGAYDLYCQVTDGTDTGTDDYASNTDELTLTATNSAPAISAGATQASPASIDPAGAETTTISTTFTDADQPGVGAFNVTFTVREPDNSTEFILVNNQPNGGGGLTITDGGGGSYTASYIWDPDPGQTVGAYDLYCEVSDGTDAAIDGYAANTDELTLTAANSPPVLVAGVTQVSLSPVNRLGANTTTISATFTDADVPGLGAFNVTFRIREPGDVTELTLVNTQPHGAGGLTITDGGGGSYTASYVYDPGDTQALGLYDLYCEVTDGTDTAIDGYTANTDELEINEVVANNPPFIAAAGTTSVAPPSLDRVGTGTTEMSVSFTDSDEPGAAAFSVTFVVREHFTLQQTVVADLLQNGQGGLTVTDDGGGAYTARIDWDPADNIALGYYDLYALVSDGADQAIDNFTDNQNELLITSGGENQPPVVPGDNTFPSPAALERIGANTTVLSCTFTDADQPGIGAFTVGFKLRLPDDVGEIVLANGVGHGTGGVTISDGGGGVYTASISWDPPDAQELGYYDLYFDVSDGSASAFDPFENNLDELQIYDAISNNAPTLVAGNTFALPAAITRFGSEYTMIKSVFSDVDVPGQGAFTITFKVRDESNVEYTLINAAQDGLQGLRVRHVTGAQYEASFLWDPPVGQVTGTYDLYFEVTDNQSPAATDNYVDNAEELTVTATAVAGDGFLLRRNNDAAGCGGTASACHNIADHQSQDCLVCHAPHGTKNVFLVRETIQTPSSGARTVLFKTLGKGDPYNDPDPVEGDPISGVMADDTDGVFTNVCEVCHTTTGHHRNDGSHPPPAHHNAESCVGCHPHSDGFAVSGGGESSGGANCSCHSAQFNPMNTSTSSYHHQMDSDAADYTIASRTCLMCHVDHDIFRPDLNTGIGQRAKNLRVDITSTVSQGDAGVLANYDYTSSGSGGICLSCHTSAQTKGYTHPDGSTETVVISKTDFDAATGSHNYAVTSTFSTDGSTFSANCVKCHNDEMSKSYQNSTYKFGTHDSSYPRFLDPLGLVSPTAPLEEDFCFRCHSTTGNPNAGSNLDYYGVQAMSTAATRVEQSLGLTYAHPVGTWRGRHSDYTENAGDLADGATRHAECGDCHDVHSAAQGTHDGSSNLVSNALKGAWGVEPTSWPAAPATSNANTYATPAGYNRVEPAQKEYQICLKCHSDYTTLPAGSRNLAEEINPNYQSTHGIVQAGTNPFCNTTTMNEPWGSSKITYCSDCHRSSNAADPEGPHGSNLEHLLVATAVSDNANGTPLCYVCHSQAVYWSSGATASRFTSHPSTQGQHKVAQGCFACHMWEFSTDTGVGINSTASLSSGTIYVHGMNKQFTLNEQDGSAGTGQLSDAFVDGYLENMDFTGRACWAETCKTHSNKSY
jgi:hypothetical protein